MTHTLSRIDRLRIERAVWTLDTHLGDLPWRSRVAKRRELRANLQAAASDVGSAEAVRRLGNVRRLAAEYLSAEYGEWGPRPSWATGIAFLLVTQFFLGLLLDTGTSGFNAAIAATHPHATGVFHWHGVTDLLDGVTFTFVNGKSTTVGGEFTPLVYVCLVAGTVLTGRLWRLLPAWRRRHSPSTSER